MAFRPKLVPTLFTIPALIALLALGSWQVQRLYWKDALIDKLQSRASAAAIELSANPEDLDALEYKRISVEGQFDHANEFHLVNRSLNGNPGVHIITPLIRANGDVALLVNRGWVPFDKKSPSQRVNGQITGSVKVEGIVRLVKGPGLFTPKNEPKKNFWFFIDPPTMGRLAKLSVQSRYYLVDGNKAVPGGFPIGRQWTLKIRNDHLHYAITWYALAIALLAIYVLYHRKS
ncbi:MAG: surfeit locus 1 family protein [Rhodospirillaceae bacterium]|nr:surfeit locus 1 family protein [Rhodospirillaceae bacterium]